MPLSHDFWVSTAPSPFSLSHEKKRRPAPFSLRLNAEERARLAIEAAGAPLGAYIKSKLLGGVAPVAPKRRRSGLPVEDRQALAQALALLGRSHIANNLNQLAHAANIGALPLDPETIADLNDAVALVRELRELIMCALGLKAEAGP